MELTGGWTVPQILIDGRPIGGYTELVRLDRDGRARRLLAACVGRALAGRAVPRAAAGDDDPLDRRAAAVARLARAAVDLELVLHRARLAVRLRGSRGASRPAARCRARARGGSPGAARAPRRRRGCAPRAAGGCARARAPRRRRCSRRRRPCAGRGSRALTGARRSRAARARSRGVNARVERLGAEPRVEVGVDARPARAAARCRSAARRGRRASEPSSSRDDARGGTGRPSSFPLGACRSEPVIRRWTSSARPRLERGRSGTCRGGRRAATRSPSSSPRDRSRVERPRQPRVVDLDPLERAALRARARARGERSRPRAARARPTR